jgi:hypothetical protein
MSPNMSRVYPALSGLAIVIVIAVTPLLGRVAVDRFGPPVDETPSYLPSAEERRARRPFVEWPIEALRDMKPGIVIIGDSIAGRVHPGRLSELTGVEVAPLLRAGSGPAVWYLQLKNYVVASGARPQFAVVFFRDTNLTDLTFRMLGEYRGILDDYALDLEPELDRQIATRSFGPWHRAHTWLDRSYAVERTRAWLEPELSAWAARVVAGRRGGLRLQQSVNERFSLENLRPMPLTDMSVISEFDAEFEANVETSVLPLMLDLAREHGLRLVFVRGQRRMEDGSPRVDTPALRQYMLDLRSYLEARGASLIDDQFDPEVARLPYIDLEHLADSAIFDYTAIFARRLEALRR